MSFLTNLILFSPLLFMGLIILMVLDRAEELRKGAGLKEKEKERARVGEGERGEGGEDEEDTVIENQLGSSGEDEDEDGNGNENENENGVGGVGNTNRMMERLRRRGRELGVDYSGGDGGGGGEGVIGDGYGDDIDIGATGAETGTGMIYGEENLEQEAEEGDENDPLLTGPSTGHHLPPHPAAAAAAAAGQPPPNRPTPRTRNIGPKKAASLARKDQRRAYHEFHRSRALAAAEQSRAEDENRLDELFSERQRRAVAEEEIALRREKERLAKLETQKQEENKAKLDLQKLVNMIKDTGRKVWKISELCEGVGRTEEWVLRGLEKEGLVGVVESKKSSSSSISQEDSSIDKEPSESSPNERKTWEMRMVTGKGYYIVVREKEIEKLFDKLDNSGSKGMSWSEMGRALEEIMELE